jgi:glycosyltransferase involved in cell wall biosynthesis
MKRIGFVLEQSLGHVAYGMSLRRALGDRKDFEPVWIEISYDTDGLGRLPIVGRSAFLRANLRTRFAIARAHRERPLDALFVHTESISLLSVDYVTRIPTLLSFDATPKNFDALAVWYAHPVGSGPRERAKLAVHRNVMHRARAITTWSEWAKDSVVGDYGVEAGAVTVLHPGVTLESFNHREYMASRRSGPMRILFVGGDFERKGGDLLLRTYREHFRSSCELHLVTSADIAGGDGVFVHRGVPPQSEKLLQLYAEADVFVLPTRADCFGIVLAEAMAAGLPIITTRIAAIPEAVKDNESGFVIDVDDAEALRDRLQRLVATPVLRARMGEVARGIAEARFDINKNAARIVELLLDMALPR